MKKSFNIFPFILLIIFQSTISSQTIISSAGLKEDFVIMKKSLLSLHPGLYKYNDSITIAKYFDDFENQLIGDLTTAQAYLAFSKFIAQIKCGHTYCNYWNQPELIKNEVFNKNNKVPFTFNLIDGKMLIDKNLSESELLKRGTEIKKINNVTVNEITNTLIKYVRGDGGNNGQRLKEIELSGLGEHEAFDILFPLLFPPEKGTYKIEAMEYGSNKIFDVNVQAVTRGERLKVMNDRYGAQPDNYDAFWDFKILNDKTAYLKLGTFVTWKMKMDWEDFIENAFDQIEENKIPNVIIDIRGNGGGNDEVYMKLSEYMITKSIEVELGKSLLRYEKVPDDLNKYLNTWDDSFRDRVGQLVKLDNGYYSDPDRETSLSIYPGSKAYKGKMYLLIDASNASATFILARIAKANALATLIGEETGGNRRGINGSQLFFLRLPNSKIEIDIPLIGNYPLTPQPDEGVKPDIFVKQTAEDFISGRDTFLEAVKKIISAN